MSDVRGLKRRIFLVLIFWYVFKRISSNYNNNPQLHNIIDHGVQIRKIIEHFFDGTRLRLVDKIISCRHL